MEMKGQFMQIIGSVGDRIVIIKAKSFMSRQRWLSLSSPALSPFTAPQRRES